MTNLRLPFKLDGECSITSARAATMETMHGKVQTPVFMPVGTKASVKGLRVEDLKQTGSQIILANTYHLHLRPGPETFQKFGGIHKLINWDGPVLTDSGGFQIFSLPHARTLTEEGAAFRSYINGSPVFLSPEVSIATQLAINSDIMMVLDQCIPSTASYQESKDAMELTHRWALRSLKARGDNPNALFGIVQGALYKDLRKQSAAELIELNFEGYAIGGLAVGESKKEREEFCAYSAELLPKHKPRYLMGVGTPIDLLEAVRSGVDMFDCIIPTALSQQGVAYTSKGRLRLVRSVYKNIDEPIDSDCRCYACANYSKAYIHHLHKSSESLGWQLTSIHNLEFYHRLTKSMRDHIIKDSFFPFYKEQKENLILQDEEYPAAPPRLGKVKRVETNEIGAFALHQSREGHFSIKHIDSGEIMHPKSDPNIEAERLYVQQANLTQRLAQAAFANNTTAKQELVIWDVGLGAAYNATAAVRAYEAYSEKSVELGESPSGVVIYSFENDLDALRLSLSHVGRFSHLKHPAPHVLIKEGEWSSKQFPIRWKLLEGDFFEGMDSPNIKAPNFIFYDPYSYKTNSLLWTLETFSKIFAICKNIDTELFSYTASTRVRAAMLAAGFFVAKGLGTGIKEETTMALSDLAYKRRTEEVEKISLLNEQWLTRWERSQARYPFALPDTEILNFEQKIRTHRQFLFKGSL